MLPEMLWCSFYTARHKLINPWQSKSARGKHGRLQQRVCTETLIKLKLTDWKWKWQFQSHNTNTTNRTLLDFFIWQDSRHWFSVCRSCCSGPTCSFIHTRTGWWKSHSEQIGVWHFNMWTAGAGDQTSAPLISRGPLSTLHLLIHSRLSVLRLRAAVNFLFLRAFFAEPYRVAVKLTFELLNVTLSFYPLGPGTQSVFSEFQHLFSIVPNEERAYAAAGGRPREGLFYSESFIVQPLFELNISHPLWWHHLRSFSLLASAITFTIFVLCLLWIISSQTSSSLSVHHTAATWTLVLRRVSQRVLIITLLNICDK